MNHIANPSGLREGRELLQRCRLAALLIDAERAVLIEANAPGAAALGLDPETLAGPVALDAAMPALAELRRLARDGLPGGPVDLAFWTRTGLQRWSCGVRTIAGGRPGPSAVLVTFHLARPATAEAADAADPALAHLVHELRSPFAAILALADVMAEGRFGPLPDPRYQDYAESIRDTARHALGVVEATLPRRGALPLDAQTHGAPSAPQMTFAEIDLMATAGEVLRGLGALADSAGMTLVLAPAPGLPRVIADRTAIRQMLLNLAVNALKYAGRGARLTILAGQGATCETWLEIADDGPGMTGEAIAAALSHEARPRPGVAGTGLGLPLTRRLAVANGATLALEPNHPRGLAARITFEASRSVPV